jgi:hypothetical protein
MSMLCCILAIQRATTCDRRSVHVAVSGLQHESQYDGHMSVYRSLDILLILLLEQCVTYEQNRTRAHKSNQYRIQFLPSSSQSHSQDNA